MKDVLGGKGAGLAEMTNLGIPVPPGFTIAASLCVTYLETRQFPPWLRSQVETSLQRLEAATNRHFGGRERPAAGLGALRRRGLDARHDGDDPQPRPQRRDGGGPAQARAATRISPGTPTAGSCRCTATVVFDLPKAPFEHLLEAQKKKHKAERDIDLPAEEIQALVHEFKEHVEKEAGRPFPDDPMEQLWGAIAAVFESWNTRRAIDYRKLHDIPDSMGTAVNVVTMVFGNLGEDSGTGVAFTRDPSTGERRLYGEYLLNAQGEDVVSGTRTPEPIARLKDAMPAGLHRAGPGGADPGAALPRRAGHGVHHRARQALHAADPAGPALRAGRGAHRLRDGGRRC